MRFRFILSETWTSLRRNVPMLLSVMLVTFISFLFIGASLLTQAQITKAKGDWYDKVEVVVWLCPDGNSQSANCSTGKAATTAQINELQKVIQQELPNDVSQVTFMSREDFYNNSFVKQYPKGEYQGRTLTAADMQDSLWLKLKNPENYRVVSEVLSNRDGVEEVVDQRQIFEPVFAILNRATVATGGLAVIMVIAAIMLTGTTIRMSAASRRGDRDHALGRRLQLDHPSAVHSRRRHCLAGGLPAFVRCIGIVRQGVRDRLAGEVGDMDSICG